MKDLKSIEKMLDNVSHSLQCMDPLDPSLPPMDFQRVHQSNKCLQWVYDNHLKGKYSREDTETILGLFKLLLIPYLQSIRDPDSLSYMDLFSLLKGVLTKFK